MKARRLKEIGFKIIEDNTRRRVFSSGHLRVEYNLFTGMICIDGAWVSQKEARAIVRELDILHNRKKI